MPRQRETVYKSRTGWERDSQGPQQARVSSGWQENTLKEAGVAGHGAQLLEKVLWLEAPSTFAEWERERLVDAPLLSIIPFPGHAATRTGQTDGARMCLMTMRRLEHRLD